MKSRELLAALVAASGNLQAAHIRFREAGREDICQLLREAALKVGTAIHLHEHDRREEQLS